jgi:hypothetical protein
MTPLLSQTQKMENENIEKSSNVILSIIFVAIFLGVMILALVVIIGSLNTAYTNANGNPISTGTVINETGWINQTGYTLSAFNLGLYNFTNPTITALWNKTSNKAIVLANATVSSSGIVTNATALIWNNASISYTYQYYSNNTIQYAGNNIQNSVISMIINFFALAPTIGTIFAVVILIGGIVLLVIYVRRMKGEETSGTFNG